MIRSLNTSLTAVGLAVALAACGGSSGGTADTTPSSGTSSTPGSTATGPADEAAAKAEITDTWTTFFHTGTARSTAVDLLEDGDELGKALDLAEREDRRSHLDRRVEVRLISFLTATTANVTYTLFNKTNELLPNASGQAVLVDGHWKVSKTTFCTLVMLGNGQKPVAGCSA